MPETLRAAIERQAFGNSVWDYGRSLALFAVVLYGLLLLRDLLVSRLKEWADRTETDIDDLVIDLLAQVRTPEIHLLALYISTRSLVLDPVLAKVLKFTVLVVLSVRAVKLLQACLSYGVQRWSGARAEKDPGAVAAAKSVSGFLSLGLWAGAVVFVLDNLGINVSAVVAGLGIGGVAVALAAQALLGDLFSSLVISLDRPFVLGDFIIVGDMMGTVEHIGIKTTRIRSLWGELLVFSNSDLTSSRVRNYKRMQRRRIQFGFGILYETPPEKVERIPALVREIVSAVPDATFDRAHFKGFGDSSLDFEVVYYVESPDYNLYMDRQQQINFALFRRLAQEGVGFAYPTRTLYLKGEAAK